MKIGKGVEWAAHACALLALLPANASLSLDALANYLGVPAPYLAKQLQMLSRANLVSAKRGVSGGYRLARLAETITLWDITSAIEGTSPSFRCTEVRQKGPCGISASDCQTPCTIASSFSAAEKVYRESLNRTMLHDIVYDMSENTGTAEKQRIKRWISANASMPS